jgi:hypothetical protein
MNTYIKPERALADARALLEKNGEGMRRKFEARK